MSKPIPPNPNLSAYDPYVSSLEEHIEHLEKEVETYHMLVTGLSVALFLTTVVLLYVLT